jgi:hypothetical protein
VKYLTRTKELQAKEYTRVSRHVTTSHSVQDSCTEALVIPTQPIGFPVSDHRVFKCGKKLANLPVGPKSGSGRCYFRATPGDYIGTTDKRQYAAARLISGGNNAPLGTVQRPVGAPNQQSIMHKLISI